MSANSSSSPSRLEIVMSTYALAVFVVLWAGLLMTALFDLDWPDELWTGVGQLPIWAAVIVWVLFLPVMVALFLLQSSWPIGWQVLGFVVIAGWTLGALRSAAGLRGRSSSDAG